MKKTTFLCSLIMLLSLLIACQSNNNEGIENTDTDTFQELLSYCEENALKSGEDNGSYYKLNWTDVDSSENGFVYVDYTVCVYENRKITITGKSIFPYNEGIENEVVYTVSFVYGTNKDIRINYTVNYELKMTRLKDSYNYYPYTIDAVKMSDTKAVFNIEKWTASCYFEEYTSVNNLINFDDCNETLRSVSVDSFNQLERYFNGRTNISLFGK